MFLIVGLNSFPVILIDAGHLNQFFNNSMPFIMGGDFNSRNTSFGATSGNANGARLLDAQDRFGFQILNPSQPTYVMDGFSYIDKFICSVDLPLSMTPIRNLVGFSDHSAICSSLNVPGFSAFVERRHNYKKINFERFNHSLEKSLDCINMPANVTLGGDDLEQTALRFDIALLAAINVSCPLAPVDNKISTSSQTRHLHIHTKRLTRLLHKSRDPHSHIDFLSVRSQLKLTKIMFWSSLRSDINRHEH